jgi:hypothetical protein
MKIVRNDFEWEKCIMQLLLKNKNRIRANMKFKVLIAILSTFLFSFIITVTGLDPMTDNYEIQSSYSPFLEKISLYIVYSLPIYLLAGIPFSYLIDKLAEKINNIYVKIFFYILFGKLAGLIVYKILLLSEFNLMWKLSIFRNYISLGIVAGLVFYILDSIFIQLTKKFRKIKS